MKDLNTVSPIYAKKMTIYDSIQVKVEPLGRKDDELYLSESQMRDLGLSLGINSGKSSVPSFENPSTNCMFLSLSFFFIQIF